MKEFKVFGLSELEDFMSDLDKYAQKASDENVSAVLMAGAQALADDVHKLPKPRRKVASGGYAHMLDEVTAQAKGAKAQVGWPNDKFYGYFVEIGTKKMPKQPHIGPTWQRNKNRYYSLMAQKLFSF